MWQILSSRVELHCYIVLKFQGSTLQTGPSLAMLGHAESIWGKPDPNPNPNPESGQGKIQRPLS